MRPPGPWGPEEFAQFTEDELHETMMGSEAGSNHFEWAKAELQHRDRRRAQSLASVPQQRERPSEATDNTSTMRGVQKTVFISYRRTAASWAQAISQNLTQHGFDVFIDFQDLASGGFEEVIFENIEARAHFVVLLTANALERCRNPKDLFRREIERALNTKRNIIPLMFEGFDFSAPEVEAQLSAASLESLSGYNGLRVPADYFPAAMERLREKFLNVPRNLVLHPLSSSGERLAKQDQSAAASAPAVTEEDLRAAAQPRYTFNIKVPYQDDLERVDGTRAEEKNGPGTLIVYDGDAVVARYNKIERWSRVVRNT